MEATVTAAGSQWLGPGASATCKVCLFPWFGPPWDALAIRVHGQTRRILHHPRPSHARHWILVFLLLLVRFLSHLLPSLPTSVSIASLRRLLVEVGMAATTSPSMATPACPPRPRIYRPCVTPPPSGVGWGGKQSVVGVDPTTSKVDPHHGIEGEGRASVHARENAKVRAIHGRIRRNVPCPARRTGARAIAGRVREGTGMGGVATGRREGRGGYRWNRKLTVETPGRIDVHGEEACPSTPIQVGRMEEGHPLEIA